MKKKSLSLTLAICIALSLFSGMTFCASAATNPYGRLQTINGVTTVRCTYYAWQQAYDNTGVALPALGNGGQWYSNAKNQGLSTGTVAKAKAIACYSGGSYGHVAYVVSVNGSTMTINEGGITYTNGSAYNGDGIRNGATSTSVVGNKKDQYSSMTLQGFIYLSDSGPSSVTITCYPSKNTIQEHNAILWGKVDKPASYSVDRIGIAIRKETGTYSNGWSKYEPPTENYVGKTYMHPLYNMNDELGLTLESGTTYCYKFYAKVNGTEYWSAESSFKTTGTHSHTYSSTWSKDSTYHWKVCAGCGNVGNKANHTWNSGSITKQPNCNNTGTKTYTCTVCGGTKVETIAKNNSHNFVNGKCSVCGYQAEKVKFPDVTYTSWYGDSVAYAVGAGLMKGYGNGKFGTSDGIQRQDFVIILSRLSGDDLSVYEGQKAFKDVDPNAYYATALAWAKANGVSSGYQDGSFGVGKKVTREQIMTFLHNYAVLQDYDVTVTDAEKAQIRAQYSDFVNVSGYAQEATYWALKNGVISGKQINGKRYISPGSPAQRCEVAAMFYNINEKAIFA